MFSVVRANRNNHLHTSHSKLRISTICADRSTQSRCLIWCLSPEERRRRQHLDYLRLVAGLESAPPPLVANSLARGQQRQSSQSFDDNYELYSIGHLICGLGCLGECVIVQSRSTIKRPTPIVSQYERFPNTMFCPNSAR